jgi:hypothetical protein
VLLGAGSWLGVTWHGRMVHVCVQTLLWWLSLGLGTGFPRALGSRQGCGGVMTMQRCSQSDGP